MTPAEGTVVAFAGRRIDAPDAEVQRFPPTAVAAAEVRLRELLQEHGAVALVSSAACGADLIALRAAESLGVRARVILPFEARRFRETSVVDRGGEWGALYDQQLERAASTDDLVVLQGAGEGSAAYAAANAVILQETARLADELAARPLAIILWEGSERPGGDLTAALAAAARSRGWEVVEVRSGNPTTPRA